MHSSSSSLVAAVVAVATTALAAACTSTSPGAEGDSSDEPSATQLSETASPPPEPPRVSECRALTFDDVSRFSNNTEPKPCRDRHTAYTFAVGELPSEVAFDGVKIDNDAVQRAAAETCEAEFALFIGGSAETRTLARLSSTYFVPNQRDFDLGARWVRCDLIGLQNDSALAPLPEDTEGFLDQADALDEYGVCSKGEPGSRDFVLVMCRGNHNYRAIEAIRLGESDAAYPGREVTAADGRDQCEALVADRLGVDGGYTFGWTYPSPADWADGQRFGFCWLETSD